MLLERRDTLMAYSFLRGKIAERGIKKSVIASVLGITQPALNHKIEGKSPFKWTEACLIQSKFFPDMDKDTLFTADERTA